MSPKVKLRLKLFVLDRVVAIFGRNARYRIIGKVMVPDYCRVEVAPQEQSRMEKSFLAKTCYVAMDPLRHVQEGRKSRFEVQRIRFRGRPNYAMQPDNLSAGVCAIAFLWACGPEPVIESYKWEPKRDRPVGKLRTLYRKMAR